MTSVWSQFRTRFSDSCLATARRRLVFRDFLACAIGTALWPKDSPCMDPTSSNGYRWSIDRVTAAQRSLPQNFLAPVSFSDLLCCCMSQGRNSCKGSNTNSYGATRLHGRIVDLGSMSLREGYPIALTLHNSALDACWNLAHTAACLPAQCRVPNTCRSDDTSLRSIWTRTAAPQLENRSTFK